MSKSEMLTEAAKLEKQISQGKLRGKKLQAAKYRMYNLRYRAKKSVQSSKPKAKVTAAERKSAKNPKFPDSKQMTLPGFIEQLNNATSQEMVANLFREALQKRIESAADAVVAKIIPFKKAE